MTSESEQELPATPTRCRTHSNSARIVHNATANSQQQGAAERLHAEGGSGRQHRKTLPLHTAHGHGMPEVPSAVGGQTAGAMPPLHSQSPGRLPSVHQEAQVCLTQPTLG